MAAIATVFYTTLHLNSSHPATSTRKGTSRFGPDEPLAEEHCPVLLHPEYPNFSTAKSPNDSKTVSFKTKRNCPFFSQKFVLDAQLTPSSSSKKKEEKALSSLKGTTESCTLTYHILSVIEWWQGKHLTTNCAESLGLLLTDSLEELFMSIYSTDQVTFQTLAPISI